MPFFNWHASVIMGALKIKPPHSFTPAMSGFSNLNFILPARVHAKDMAPVWARPSRRAAGVARRCASGTSN
jgi:hypothetical protein